MPQVPKETLLSKDSFLTIPDVYEVKKINTHEDFNGFVKNNLAILTLAKPFDSETQKGELQTKNYRTKSKVQSNLVNNGYSKLFQPGKDTLYQCDSTYIT